MYQCINASERSMLTKLNYTTGCITKQAKKSLEISPVKVYVQAGICIFFEKFLKNFRKKQQNFLKKALTNNHKYDMINAMML